MAVLHPYHPSLAALLASFPASGRFHRWLFQVSLHLRHYHSREWALAFLKECAHDMDRAVPDTEIEKAVQKAYALEAEQYQTPVADWMPVCQRRIDWVRARVKAPLFGLADTGLGARDVLPLLYDPGELVCSGKYTAAAITEPVESLLEAPEGRQFIVPNPMTAPTGVNSAGEVSARCLNNTGPRRYLVIENDLLDKSTQVLILTHLAAVAPLVLVVDTAGKSLHGWFHVAGTPEPRLRLFMHYACTLGADPHTWTRCQWVRMPGGSRPRAEGFARQPIIYFNKEALSCPAP